VDDIIKVNNEEGNKYMAESKQSLIRNFSIIAHIDHGKSTLADRFLEYTGTIDPRKMQPQVLDRLESERERGITIKLQAVRMHYQAKDKKDYVLNLIDTPGHVDFSYEVSRSLAACEGALLVVDASQGVEAQTVANLYLALENNLEIIPVVNKIDLPGARVEETLKEIEDLGLDISRTFKVSAKTGEGIEELLEGIVKYISAPQGDPSSPLRALIFDSYYDSYRGAIPYIRLFEGTLKKGMMIKMIAGKKEFEVEEVGIFNPFAVPIESLSAGEVGYLCASIKNISDVRVGDTVTEVTNPAGEPLPGYRKITPMVFCSIFPVDNKDFEHLASSMEKLSLNDAALVFEPQTSEALGFGFRCGFLGLLHLEIVKERLEKEYGLKLIATVPSVLYRVIKADGEEIYIDNPSELPPPNEIDYIEEPVAEAMIMTPSAYIGEVMGLCQEKRGNFKGMEYLSQERVMLTYHLPLSEIILDFFDKLKSRTRGFASLDYKLLGYQKEDLVKVDILINGQVVDALSFIVHRSQAYHRGRQVIARLKEVIDRQLFEVTLQAAIGSRVISRETIKPLGKNVLAKCYGGDITRKRKLLEKQKEGKKRMKKVGKVEIPEEAFMALFELEKEK
jgi:GTP-binding protein LepA